jgi:hypothetical protein
VGLDWPGHDSVRLVTGAAAFLSTVKKPVRSGRADPASTAEPEPVDESAQLHPVFLSLGSFKQSAV